MPKSINLTGTAGKKYDLEALSTTNTRESSSDALIVQIWYWNPNGIESYKSEKDKNEKYEDHKKPNPPNPQLGQIWLSKLVKEDFVEEV